MFTIFPARCRFMTGTTVEEEERPREIEVQQLLPLGEAQLLDGGRRLADDRAAADRVDENVDAVVRGHRAAHHVVDLRGVETVGDDRVRHAARGADGADDILDGGLVAIDGDDSAAFTPDDLGGGPANAPPGGSDQRDASLESHARRVYRTRAGCISAYRGTPRL